MGREDSMSTAVLSPLDTALRLAASGLSVIPIRCDGSKKPACWAWAEYQTRIPTGTEIGELFRGRCGLGIVAGDESGGLEVLDIESDAPFPEFCELVREHDPALLDALPHVGTPSGGHHLFYRCDEIDTNQKLADKVGADGKPSVIFETRGRGGYVVSISSPPDCHEDRTEY